MELDYVGPSASASADIITYPYPGALLPTGLTTTQVNDRISADLAGKVLKSYVDSQDALNATPAYVNAGDATKLKVAQKDAANGILSLGATGKASISRFSATSTQRFNSGIWTPGSYGTASGVTADTTVHTMTVSDPGYAYKIVVFGIADVITSSDFEHPIVTVRVGSTTGTVIGEGRGAADSYTFSTGINGGDDFERFDGTDIGSTLWSTLYDLGNTTGGYDAITDGHQARWVDQGGGTHYALHKRIDSTDMRTNTNDQVITLTAGSIVAETTLNFDNNDAVTFLISRASDDFQNFVAVGLYSITSNHKAQWVMRRNGTFSTPSGTVTANITQQANAVWSLVTLGTQYTLLKNNVATGASWNDTTSQSLMGSTARGWGWGHQGAARNFASGQTTPGSVADIRIQDNQLTDATSKVNVIPINYASQSVLTGATNLFMRVNRSGSSSQVGLTSFQPKLVAFAIPA